MFEPITLRTRSIVISLEQAKILVVDHATLFRILPRAHQLPIDGKRFSSSSQVRPSFSDTSQNGIDKFRFAAWRRTMRTAKSYPGFALDPLPEERGAASRPYRYIIYAFIDLEADVQYVGGRPAITLDLKAETFESLTCHLLGVTRAPVLFPRSNDVVVPDSTFRTLLRRWKNAR